MAQVLRARARSSWTRERNLLLQGTGLDLQYIATLAGIGGGKRGIAAE